MKLLYPTILLALGPPHRCFVLLGKRREGSSESYWVPLIINRHSGFPDIGWALVDTGFTGSLSLPSDVVEFLRANGWLTGLDRPGPPNVVVLADGAQRMEPTVIIRELILPGCRAFRNVRTTISRPGSDPAIGMGLLSAFATHGIDRKELLLTLVPPGLDR
jgi:hypothetical protein